MPVSKKLQDRIITLGFALEETIVDGARHLALRDLGNDKLQPLMADFLSGSILHRLKHSLGRSQPFARALGLGSLPKGAFVIDVTAGLGVDAFFAAALGCRVHAIERNEVVFALLADADRRFREAVAAESHSAGSKLAEIAERLSFAQGDAVEVLSALKADARPEVIYLDPMYPEEGRAKSALPKKAMQIFRRVIGDDGDASDVFAVALGCARKRVVVKRPLHGLALGDLKPTHVFAGKTARYDVYVTQVWKSGDRS